MDVERVRSLARLLEESRFDEKCEDYLHTWGPVDREIRHLCEVRCPGHDSFENVYPKVTIVDGAYRAGLSRCLNSSSDPRFSAQSEAAKWMCSPVGRESVESAIANVSLESRADLTTFMGDCLMGHGIVVSGLQKLGDSGKWPTSFTAKYLHFHNKDYVIYDSVVDARILKLLSRVGGIPRRASSDGQTAHSGTYSEAYYQYLRRFLYVMAAARELRPAVTVKEVDHFLWNAWQ